MHVLLLAAVLVLAPDDTSWRDNPNFVRAAAAFEAKRFAEAADAFAIAEAEEHRPELLWAWAQSLRFARRCEAAIEVYSRYLATSPPTKYVELARANIRVCGGDPDAPPPEPEVVTPVPAPRPTTTTDVPPPLPPRRAPPSRDAWGHALTWPGVVLLGVGAGLLGEAHARDARAHDAADEAAYRDAIAGAPTLSRAGLGVLTAGAALVTAGIVRFAIVGARARRSSRTTMAVLR